MSMEKKETMADYESELEKSFRKIKEGDMIEGIVIGVRCKWGSQFFNIK